MEDTMFELERFVEDCRVAVNQDHSHKTIETVVKKAFSEPSDILTALGEPKESGLFPIYNSVELTIVNVVWKPGMTVMPHNHEMWAVIGIYGGREDNIFWRRLQDDAEGRIEAAGARALSTGDTAPLGKNIIHSVTNPISKLTGAIHVYGGDFFEIDRSEWDAEKLSERPYDIDKLKALFSN
jgi:predicted metal-dependent enzyme (double-stranded beta helix superfamily)